MNATAIELQTALSELLSVIDGSSELSEWSTEDKAVYDRAKALTADHVDTRKAVSA